MLAELALVFVVGGFMGLTFALHRYFVGPAEDDVRAIWNAHRNGGFSVDEIAAMSGWSKRHVRKALGV